jgi:UDP-N-acetylmuramoyl-tripeptide--D-alanyl-D-alanine ligase
MIKKMLIKREYNLFSADLIQQLLNGRWLVKAVVHQPVTQVKIDNHKRIQTGDLYFDLKHNINSVKKLESAFNKGASVIVVSNEIKEKLDSSWNVLLVDSVSGAFGKLTAHVRKKIKGKVICVTGSAGKTSTVSALGQVLSNFGHTAYQESNRNLYYQIALSMIETPENSDYAIYEVAATARGLVRQSQLIKPNIVIFTGTGKSHLSYMHSQLIVADLKSQLFYALEPDGIAIINRDDKYFNRIEEAAKDFGAGQIISFGTHPSSSVCLIDYTIDIDGTDIKVAVFGKILQYRINLPGKHWVMNTLSILATAHALDIDTSEMIKTFETIEPVSRRGDKHNISLDSKNIVIYNESFNGNPLSMQVTIEFLQEIPLLKTQRKILVLGEMLALGENEISEHIKLAESINNSSVDKVYACGELMKYCFDALNEDKKGEHTKDANSLTELLIEQLQNGDVLAIKGSRGNRMEQIIETLNAISS